MADYIVDQEVDWHVVWVPGTWGDDVHEGFEAAVHERLGSKAQLHCVHYPADADFAESVPQGVGALLALLIELGVHRQKFQRVIVGGSSQGAWVIREAMKDTLYHGVVYKTVTFGLPGITEYEPLKNDWLWDIASPYDAVTWEWNGPERRIVKYASSLVRGKWWNIIPLLPYLVLNPFTAFGMIGLLMTHFKIPRLSPHDYTPQMPLALAWATN